LFISIKRPCQFDDINTGQTAKEFNNYEKHFLQFLIIPGLLHVQTNLKKETLVVGTNGIIKKTKKKKKRKDRKLTQTQLGELADVQQRL